MSDKNCWINNWRRQRSASKKSATKRNRSFVINKKNGDERDTYTDIYSSGRREMREKRARAYIVETGVSNVWYRTDKLLLYTRSHILHI